MPAASSHTWAAERLWWPITAGTYTLQGKMETNDSAFTPAVGVYLKKTLTDTAAALTTVTASGSKTITVGASGYIGLYLHLTMDTGNTGARTVRYYDIQLEPGNTATAYEPYTGATVTLPTLEPLYGDGTVSDEYDAATGIETRRWKRMELDGTESGWRTSPTEDNTCLLYTSIDTGLNTSGFEKDVKNLPGKMGGITSSLKGIATAAAAAFSVKAIVDFGKSAIELGSNIAEVQNVVDTAFGDMAYKAEAFADTSIEQFGMSTLSAKKTASTYMAMAKGMGLADGVASDMATVSYTHLDVYKRQV